jgi:glycogen phosphorylase
MANVTKDPVCEMVVHPERSITASYRGQQFFFCSDYCKRAFLENPDKYAGETQKELAAESDTVRRIAYFSMEIGIDSAMPTYSGGLGVLAGDTLKAAADLKLPMVAVSLLNAKAYFDQTLDAWGNQQEHPVNWHPVQFARKLLPRVQVAIEGHAVLLAAWQ